MTPSMMLNATDSKSWIFDACVVVVNVEGNGCGAPRFGPVGSLQVLVQLFVQMYNVYMHTKDTIYFFYT